MPDPQDTRHEFRGSMPADTLGSHISVSMSMRDARVRVTRLKNHVAAFVGDVSVLLTAEQWRYFITQRQWFVWPVAITLGMIGSGIATSTPAQAAEYGSGQNEVCAYLDARPNVAGVEDLIGIAVHNGMTGYDAGTVIAQAVVNYCPRHLPTLDAYIAKWG